MPARDAGGISVRHARASDADELVKVQLEAVRAAGAAFYTPEVLLAWAPEPSPARAEELRRALGSEGEAWVVAELEGRVVGFGAVAFSARAVRGVYVAPSAARRGAGGAIVAELERLASARGLATLDVSAALNAQKFFARHGYRVAGRHVERFGPNKLRMACLQMQKALPAAAAEPAARAQDESRFIAVYPIGDTDPQGLPVREIGPAIGYYTCVLGFSLVSKTKDTAVLARDAVRLGVSVNGKDPEQASCYFEVTDVAALHRELTDKGIEPSDLREERNAGQVQRIFFAKEPFGVCFCFGQTEPRPAPRYAER